jgi:hypothetical protein
MKAARTRLVFRDHLGNEHVQLSPYRGQMAEENSRRALRLEHGLKGGQLTLIARENLFDGPMPGPRARQALARAEERKPAAPLTERADG